MVIVSPEILNNDVRFKDLWGTKIFTDNLINLVLHRCSLCIGMYFQNIDLTYIHYCLLQNPVLAVPTAVMGAQPSGTIYIAALEILRAVGAVEWPSSSATSQTTAYRHSKLCQSLGKNKKNKV